MPSVYNGIGTWYYGKNNIHRRVSYCNQCNRVGELESYDTPLEFVVFFIPVIHPTAIARIAFSATFLQAPLRPRSSKDIIPLARKLDFHHDVTSLCLKSLR